MMKQDILLQPTEDLMPEQCLSLDLILIAFMSSVPKSMPLGQEEVSNRAKMLDDIKKRFEFPNAVVQSQAVGHLIAAVLKENASSEKIREASHQTPALNLLWEKCCSENVALRTACSEGLVALVVEKHAEFDYVLHGALNLIPSARNVHGLVKTIWKLLQIQAIQLEKDGDKDVWNLYGIRSNLYNDKYMLTFSNHGDMSDFVLILPKLQYNRECSSLISLLEDNFELLKEVFPVEQCIIGLALLLLQTPESQQKSVLSLETQNISSSALTLMMPVLQILTSTTVGDCLSEDDSGATRQQLATNLLRILQEESVKDKKELVSCKLLFPITSSYSSLYTTWKIIELMKEKSAVTNWLSSVKSLLPVTNQVPAHVFLLLAYLLIQENGDSLRDVLQATTEIAKADCSQDRIYPELQKFLAMSDTSSLSVDKDAQWEKLIAKAACIRDICRQRYNSDHRTKLYKSNWMIS
ncbi:hypothetical protein llap_6589 [Limosa lapponica baueri]|uniref:DUF3730 domain-containing protein n=1 Tax=Limosa lapponica baueri TaxID=1758121 RepID=A0A2I0UAK6_LIMLA|nr:hypothetical protein llap_6589 [Limosa lapponica baueri]